MSEEDIEMDVTSEKSKESATEATLEANIEAPSIETSLNAKEAERLRIHEEVQAFLKQGGKIDRISSDIVADPPKKPESNYGGQPI